MYIASPGRLDALAAAQNKSGFEEVINGQWWRLANPFNFANFVLGAVKAGQQIATLGDYIDGENGGWSRHVHVQMMRDLPDPNNLIGYTSREKLNPNQINYPDPSFLVFA